MTNFSPKAVGIVDKRSSVSSPFGVRVFKRPSCGLRFSATFSRPRILIRAVTATMIANGISYTVWSTPSIRKRTLPVSRRGSKWISLARCSKAYCNSQSTTLTICWSLASGLVLSPNCNNASTLVTSAAARLWTLFAPAIAWVT